MEAVRGWPLVVCLLAGCHEVFGLVAPAVDAGDGGGGADARVCDRTSAFPTGELVPIQGQYGVEAARFTPAENLAYLALYPFPGDKDETELYVSIFNPIDGTFTGFTRLNGISTAGKYDSYPTVSPDGERVLFGSARTDELKIWVATADAGSFDDPMLNELIRPGGRTASNEPYILADGMTLYFAAGVPSKWDLFRKHGAAPLYGGQLSDEVPGVNTSEEELSPVVANDELEIYFASNRDQASDYRALDIYHATRTSTSAPFGNVTRMTALSTGGTDWPVWLSPSGCTLYYINKEPFDGRARLLRSYR